ncbi:uncharacterized protein LOC135203552 [Macrobrachium nipponense]|uniref:uncharacterized protein LOC135203552 n=1 Tax=Macrobrachium nipponense TaxID=159736 RepID=UPI0030C8733B
MLGKAVGFALVLVLLAGQAQRGAGLRCYQCGTISEGMSTVNPCFGATLEDNKECAITDTHCKRYSNEGVLVLACSKDCVESRTQTTDITCCSTDGCNGAGALKPWRHLDAVLVVAGILTIIGFTLPVH